LFTLIAPGVVPEHKEKSRLSAGLSLLVSPVFELAVALVLAARILLLLLSGLLATALLLSGLLTRALILLARILILVRHRDLPG